VNPSSDSASPPPFVRVASTDEIPPGECKVVQLKDRFVAIFNVDGNFHVIDHECPHEGGPLGAGEVDGRIVICPWHGWAFDVATGRCPTSPDICVEQFPVRIVGNDIEIQIDLTVRKSLWNW
jgi:nitrite reductase (NADH) small subunit/3-phenylpropionate/trans-cinnamate dioxygenase ferredoxin subunit